MQIIPNSAKRLKNSSTALDEVEAATDWMLAGMKDGRCPRRWQGQRPILRLFGLAAGGAYLAKAGLAGAKEEHAVLARYFADNFLGECTALRQTVTEGCRKPVERQIPFGCLLKPEFWSVLTWRIP